MPVRRSLPVALILGAFPLAAPVAADPPSDGETCRVLSTASLNGDIEGGGAHANEIGGADRLAAAVHRFREQPMPTVVVDGGNFSSNLKESCGEERTRLMSRLLAGMEYDAVTPGDRELASGVPGLDDLRSEMAGVAFVSCNLLDTLDRRVLPESVVIEKDGVRFGVTGGMTGNYYVFNRTRGKLERDEFRFADLESSLRDAVARLRPRCDVLVALLHVGPGDAERLVQAVAGIDVAVVGHNPGIKNAFDAVGGTPLVRSGTKGEFLASITITRPKDGAGPGWKGELVPLGIDIRPDPRVAALVKAFRNECYGRLSRDQEARSMLSREGTMVSPIGFPAGVGAFDLSPEGALDLELDGEGGTSIRLLWPGGPLENEPRPLWARLERPDPLRPLSVVEGEATRTVPVGSEEERNLILLLKSFARSRLSSGEEDSLVAAYGSGEGLASLDRGDRAAVVSAGVARVLEEQRRPTAGIPPPYWERRSLVYLEASLGPRGAVTGVTPLACYDRRECTDSVAALVAGWRWPRTGDRRGGGAATREVVVVALDPGERRLREVERPHRVPTGETPLDLPGARGGTWLSRWTSEVLPRDLRDAVTRGPVARWLAVLGSGGGRPDLDDFVSSTRIALDSLAADPSSDMEIRSARGLIPKAPETGWGLDLFESGTATAAGRWRPLRTEVGILEPGSRTVLGRWKNPEDQILLGEWVSPRRFLLAGWSGVVHPRFPDGTWGRIQVPTLWVGNVATRVVDVYQGPPVDARLVPAIRKEMAKLQAAVYPRLDPGP